MCQAGAVNHYKLELTSIAKYVDEKNQDRYDTDKREENVSVNFTSYTFTDANANTNYNVKVSLHCNSIWCCPVINRL